MPEVYVYFIYNGIKYMVEYADVLEAKGLVVVSGGKVIRVGPLPKEAPPTFSTFKTVSSGFTGADLVKVANKFDAPIAVEVV